MVNVTFIYPRKMATTEEMYKVFTSVSAKNHGINATFVNSKKITKKALYDTDVLVFVRCLDYFSQEILRHAKRAGIFTIQYFDDDLLNLPKSSVNRVQHLHWRKKAVEKGFRHTDLILSSNILLAQKYSEMIPSKRYASMDTPVDPTLLIPVEERERKYCDDKIKIVFAAGANHEDEFNQLVTPCLSKLIEKYGKKLSITFYGVHPDLSNIDSDLDVTYFGAMSLGDYRKAIQEGLYDIGLSPLRENELSRFKYYNKFVEYTIAGIVGVYSNVLPYTLVVENGKNGFLPNNTPEAWQSALEQVIEDKELRHLCYKNAFDYVISNMNSDEIFTKLLHDIPELMEGNRNHSTINVETVRLKYLIIRFMESIYLIFTYLHMSGIKGTYKKICSYIVEHNDVKKEHLGE